MDLVQMFVRASSMHKAFGASPYGGDLNKWPSRILDAFLLLHDEQARVEGLMIERQPAMIQKPNNSRNKGR